jgi:hypothetical protein
VVRFLVALLLAVSAAIAILPAAADEADRIAVIKKVGGAAFVIDKDRKEAAQIGRALQQSDIIETGDDGSVGMTFKDNTTVSVGPHTRLALDEFVFAPEQEKYSFVTEMARGSMTYFSGTIAKLSPDSISVITPAGTLGIRGTRFALKIGN